MTATNDCYPLATCNPPATPQTTTATVSVPPGPTPTTGSTLPFTGADVIGLSSVAGVAIVVGAFMARRKRATR